MTLRWGAILPAVASFYTATPASAQSVPFADTEDGTLSEIDIRKGQGDWHPILSFDVRNGDYARGAFDDDSAGLGQVPLHVAAGGVLIVHRRANGNGALFVIGQSSNGFHAPSRSERASPRAWYESNNLLSVAWRPRDDLTLAVTYTIKTSPNAVAPTSHEGGLSVLYTGDDAFGRLKPRAAVTRRTRGDGGFYTIAGIEPTFDLASSDDGPTLSIPVSVGVGWRGFYAPDSGNRIYGSGGLSFAQPLAIAGAKATLQAQLLALVRDDRLRRLDAPRGTEARVVPYGMISLVLAW